MAFVFKRASKAQRKARIGLVGPSGAGKTYTALTIAEGLGEKIALIDTENRSASLYADRFTFDTLQLDTFAPETYVAAIKAAEEAGYEVIIIDSLSHAWMGKDGALEQVDKAAARSRSGNTFAAWREVTPKHNELVDAMIRCKAHIIVTMRAKTEYVIEQVQRNGRTVNEPRKIGMAPVQRDGLEYEFDIVADMDWEHRFIVSKTRFDKLAGEVVTKPTRELGETIKAWLSDGKPEPEHKDSVPQTQQKQSPPPTQNGNGSPKPENEAAAFEKGRKAYFAEMNNKLPEIFGKDAARNYAVWMASGLLGQELESFNDIPLDALRRIFAHVKKHDSGHLAGEYEVMERDRMGPDPVPGFEDQDEPVEQEALV